MSWRSRCPHRDAARALLLAGIVLLHRARDRQQPRAAARCRLRFVVAAAAAGRRWLYAPGYAAAPFPRAFLGRAGRPRSPRPSCSRWPSRCCSCRATTSARRAVLPAAPLVAVRRLPDALGGQLPHAVPRPRDHVAAGVRAGAARLPAAGERGGRAEVPGARRRGERDLPDGRLLPLRLERLAGALGASPRRSASRTRSPRPRWCWSSPPSSSRPPSCPSTPGRRTPTRAPASR